MSSIPTGYIYFVSFVQIPNVGYFFKNLSCLMKFGAIVPCEELQNLINCLGKVCKTMFNSSQRDTDTDKELVRDGERVRS